MNDKAWKDIERRILERVEVRRRTYGQSPKAVEAKIGEIDRRTCSDWREGPAEDHSSAGAGGDEE